jgi:hypothetical protein
MICADARNIILTADHAALRDRTDPVLRQHLEGCADCAAAAAHVVADVVRLRSALIARGARPAARSRRSSTKRVALTLVPIALAAELAAFAFLGARDNPNPLSNRLPVIDDTVTSMLPIASGPDTVETAAASIGTSDAVKPPEADSANEVDSTTASRKPQRYAPADAIAPPRATAAVLRQQVAAISRSNPRMGLVWLSKVDSL